MKQSVMAVAALGVGLMLTATGCPQSGGIGDPCTPDREFDPTFRGFSQDGVFAESRSFSCESRICLVNHYRGRTSCPFGQDESGAGIEGKPGTDGTNGSGCKVPGTNTAIVGDKSAANPSGKSCVPPQCNDRTKGDSVFCSCRCANVSGKTDDGANYCECPENFACEQLVASTGNGGNEGLSGGYCTPVGKNYKPQSSCSAVSGGSTNCSLTQ